MPIYIYIFIFFFKYRKALLVLNSSTKNETNKVAIAPTCRSWSALKNVQRSLRLVFYQWYWFHRRTCFIYDSLYRTWRQGNFQARKLEILRWSDVSASSFQFTAWWQGICCMKTIGHPSANLSRWIRKLEACPGSPSFRKANFNLWCKWKLSVVCRRCPEKNFRSDITLEWSWHCWCQSQTRDLSDWRSHTKSLFYSSRSWQWPLQLQSFELRVTNF